MNMTEENVSKQILDLMQDLGEISENLTKTEGLLYFERRTTSKNMKTIPEQPETDKLNKMKINILNFYEKQINSLLDS